MPRNLLEERGIRIPSRQPRNLLAERGISIPENEHQNIARVKQEHPYISYFGEQLAKHPNISKAVVGAADLLDPLRQGIEESGLPAAAGGAVRSLSRAAQLPAKGIDYLTGQNTAEQLRPEQWDPYIDKLPGGQAAALGGDIGMSALLGGNTFGKLNQLGGRPSGWMGLFTDALKGGGAGLLTGGTGMEGILGGGAGAAANTISKVTRGGATKLLGEKLSQLESKYNKEFGKLFHEADIKRIKRPKDIPYNEIISNTPKNYSKSLIKFERNPTLNNAQDAQSDLRKGIEWIKKKGGNASKAETDAMNSAIESRNKLKDIIRKELNKKNPEHGKRYDQINKGYKEEVAPLKYNPAILEYLETALNAGPKGNPRPAQAKMLKEMGKDVHFQGQVGRDYPEIGLSNTIHNPYFAGGIAAGGLGVPGYRLLSSLLGKGKE